MLKPLSEALQADPRFDDLVAEITEAGVRFMTLDDHHEDISGVELNADLPEAVRTAFDRARNAYLYAWFSYDLTILAEAQGYAALEMALRERLGRYDNGKRRAGIGDLLKAARLQGFFEDLPLPEHVTELDRPRYLDRLLDRLRRFRNDIMHGSAYLNVPGAALDALRDCANIINHLFAK